jgi:serine/threonine protein kinase
MEKNEVIGEYELIGQVGSGSFGTIYRALWRGKQVALKIVIFKRLRKELTILNQC